MSDNRSHYNAHLQDAIDFLREAQVRAFPERRSLLEEARGSVEFVLKEEEGDED